MTGLAQMKHTSASGSAPAAMGTSLATASGRPGRFSAFTESPGGRGRVLVAEATAPPRPPLPRPRPAPPRPRPPGLPRPLPRDASSLGLRLFWGDGGPGGSASGGAMDPKAQLPNCAEQERPLDSCERGGVQLLFSVELIADASIVTRGRRIPCFRVLVRGSVQCKLMGRSREKQRRSKSPSSVSRI